MGIGEGKNACRYLIQPGKLPWCLDDVLYYTCSRNDVIWKSGVQQFHAAGMIFMMDWNSISGFALDCCDFKSHCHEIWKFCHNWQHRWDLACQMFSKSFSIWWLGKCKPWYLLLVLILAAIFLPWQQLLCGMLWWHVYNVCVSVLRGKYAWETGLPPAAELFIIPGGIAM